MLLYKATRGVLHVIFDLWRGCPVWLSEGSSSQTTAQLVSRVASFLLLGRNSLVVSVPQDSHSLQSTVSSLSLTVLPQHLWDLCTLSLCCVLHTGPTETQPVSLHHTDRLYKERDPHQKGSAKESAHWRNLSPEMWSRYLAKEPQPLYKWNAPHRPNL